MVGMFCAAFSLQAQSRLDSLRLELDQQKDDSVRFLILLQLSDEAEFQDYALARRYATDAKILSEQIESPWAKGKLYYRLAFLESMEGDYVEALKYDQLGVQVAGTLRDSTLLARMLNDVGTDYRDLGEYQESYIYLTQAYRVARKSHKVLTYGDSLNMAIAIHNLGTVFTALKQYDIAFSHLESSARMSSALHDLDGLPYTYNELGVLYLKKGDLIRSEKYLADALKQANQRRIRVLIPRIKLDMAELYFEKEDLTRSLNLYDSIVALSISTGNDFGLAECDLGKGKVLAKLGHFEPAMQLCMKALSISRRLHARNLTLRCYEELSHISEAQGDANQSLQFLRRYNSLRDSIFSESVMEKLSQNQVRFETELRDNQINMLSQLGERQVNELRRQEMLNNIMVLVAALSLFLLYTVYRSSRRRKRINRLLLDHQEEIKKRSKELEQLNEVKAKFFSIISHDLRSPINALAGTLQLLQQQHITQEEFKELSATLFVQFNHTRTLISSLLDWTLLQMDKLNIQPESVEVQPHVAESIASILSLYPKGISIENKVQPNLACLADRNILNLVLRNLIVNAIKFTPEGGRVWVEGRTEGNEVVISVADSGAGIPAEARQKIFERTATYTTRGTANEKGTGIGLILCKEFIEKSGGRIWVESELGKGSVFRFTLPKP